MVEMFGVCVCVCVCVVLDSVVSNAVIPRRYLLV